jgi:hypothetical protein
LPPARIANVAGTLAFVDPLRRAVAVPPLEPVVPVALVCPLEVPVPEAAGELVEAVDVDETSAVEEVVADEAVLVEDECVDPPQAPRSRAAETARTSCARGLNTRSIDADYLE